MNEQEESSADEIASVLDKALSKYIERNSKYQDHWRSSGWMMHLAEVSKKAGRLRQMFFNDASPAVLDEEALDDALDLIVVTAFFIISSKEGNKHGSQ